MGDAKQCKEVPNHLFWNMNQAVIKTFELIDYLFTLNGNCISIFHNYVF